MGTERADQLWSRRLAELLAQEDGSRILRILQQLKLTATPHHGASPLLDAESTFGIWGPDGSGWRRIPERAREWNLWADLDEIPAKGQARRVVLLGESTARGHFFDPVYTPAEVLANYLQSVNANTRVEVIDLARTDLTLPELSSLVYRLPALEPDAVVLFAGNNWHALDLSSHDLFLLADAIRCGGYPLCQKVFHDDILAPRVRTLLRLLAAATTFRDVAAVLVIPEFNLVDWRSEATGLTPKVGNGQLSRWLALSAHAEGSGGTDPNVLLDIANNLVRIDAGVASASLELRARALTAHGQLDEARTALEGSRDAVCGILTPHSPRCCTFLQTMLRVGCATHQFNMVDLPAVFSAHQHGRLPNRRLYMDYCHLTAEGIGVAMSAVADEVATAIGLTRRSMTVDDKPHPRDEAHAHVLAAIHNMQFGQDQDIIRHHIDTAVSRWPEIAGFIWSSAECLDNMAPTWMDRKFDCCTSHPSANRSFGGVSPRAREKASAVRLIGAARAALGAVDDTGLKSSPSVCEIDLLESRYQTPSFAERLNRATSTAYTQCFEHDTEFAFRVITACHFVIDIAMRVPGADLSTDVVKVIFNGACVVEMRATSDWQRRNISVTQRLAPGLNRIGLRWPTPISEPYDLAQTADSVELGSLAPPFVVFGELCRLKISRRPDADGPVIGANFW